MVDDKLAANNKEMEGILANENLTAEERKAISYGYAMEEWKIKKDQFDKNKQLKHKEFQANKNWAIASTVIAGAVAVINALTTVPYPVGIALAAASVVTTGLSIAKIASQKETDAGTGPLPPNAPTSGSTSTSGSGSGSGGSFTAPQFYKLGQGGSSGSDLGPTKVFVTEEDISKVQQRMRKVDVRSTQGLETSSGNI